MKVTHQNSNALAVLPCDLSLITIHISYCRQFSDIHISQGSVETYLWCGWKFKYEFVANLAYCCGRQWKNSENRIIFGEVIGKSRPIRAVSVTSSRTLQLQHRSYSAMCTVDTGVSFVDSYIRFGCLLRFFVFLYLRVFRWKQVCGARAITSAAIFKNFLYQLSLNLPARSSPNVCF